MFCVFFQYFTTSRTGYKPSIMDDMDIAPVTNTGGLPIAHAPLLVRLCWMLAAISLCVVVGVLGAQSVDGRVGGGTSVTVLGA